MAGGGVLSVEDKVDLYRAIRGTYWSYQLSAYEDAAMKSFLPVVEEAGKRMHASVEELSKRGKEGSWQAGRASAVEREMSRLTAALNADLTEDVTAACGTVGSAAVKEYAEMLSLGGLIKSTAVALSPSQFASFFTESLPIMIPKVVSGLFDKAGLAEMQAAVLKEMQIGALTGASYDRMVKNLRQRFPEMMRDELTTMTRTFFQTANARAFDRVYKENADVVVGKTWINANDSRVCCMCLPLGGRTYYKGETHPSMPRHPRCRCLFIPKTKSLKKLGVDVKKVEETVDPVILRGRMKDGKWTSPPINTGGTAPATPITVAPGGLRAGFTSLPKEVQIAMVGPGRYEMLQSRLIKVDDLVDLKTGRLFTLDELRTRASSPPKLPSAPIKKETGVKPPPKKSPVKITDPWEDLAFEEPDAFPTALSAPWGDLRDAGAREYFLSRAKRGSGTISEMLLEDHVAPIFRVATDDRYVTAAAKQGYWASDAAAYASLDTGMELELSGTETMFRGLGEASKTKARIHGKHTFKIEVPPGMRVALADDSKILMMPGAKFKVVDVIEEAGEKVFVVQMTDDGSAFIKDLAKYWDDVEEAAGGPEARVFTKSGAPAKPVEPIKPAFEPAKPVADAPASLAASSFKTSAGIELTELQKEALDYALAKSATVEDDILNALADQYTISREILDKQYAELKKRMLDEDSYEFVFNANGNEAMWKSLAKDGKFKNQFELGSKAQSGGEVCRYKDSPRDKWEKNMYGGVFQKRKEYRELSKGNKLGLDMGRERPFYGYLHDAPLLSERRGPFSPGTDQYGKITFVLDKRRMLDRTTFTVGDSSGYHYSPGVSRQPIATHKNPISIFDAMYEKAHYSAQSVDERLEMINNMIQEGTGISGFEMYVEAQYHGGVTLDDVSVVLIPDTYEGSTAPDVVALIKMLEKKKVPYAFHDYTSPRRSAASSREAARSARNAAKK